jgi:hypothetical protein
MDSVWRLFHRSCHVATYTDYKIVAGFNFACVEKLERENPLLHSENGGRSGEGKGRIFYFPAVSRTRWAR